jgi:SAM-dependent methyltransferase
MEPDAYQEMSILEEKHWWFVSRRKLIKRLLNKHLAELDQIQILEIGCGTGGNLMMLGEFGHVLGVEMNLDAEAYSRRKTQDLNQINVVSGSAPNNLPLKESDLFDAICLFDVLEHIDEDSETLTKLINHLKPTGKIFITVPAYQWLWSAHDDFNHHKRRYTKRNLSNLLKKTGLSKIKVGYFNTFLFPLAALVRLVERAFGKQTSAGVGRPNALTNQILKNVFGSEVTISSRGLFPFGLSIWAIYELPASHS